MRSSKQQEQGWHRRLLGVVRGGASAFPRTPASTALQATCWAQLLGPWKRACEHAVVLVVCCNETRDGAARMRMVAGSRAHAFFAHTNGPASRMSVSVTRLLQ
jgi:hypothetical protein